MAILTPSSWIEWPALLNNSNHSAPVSSFRASIITSLTTRSPGPGACPSDAPSIPLPSQPEARSGSTRSPAPQPFQVSGVLRT